MCGINAAIDFSGGTSTGALKALVERMNAGMVYRGPDGEGSFAADGVALGMRRLSIIDVEGGRQPIVSEDGSVVLVCNGEIYNYRELRAKLTALGHVFSTGSDAESIVHAYEEMGTSCLSMLRGMFAFVLFDRRTRKVFAARDRIGIKPLYFVRMGELLLLSSELKALLAAGASPSLRPEAVLQFLGYGYGIDQRNTVVADVKRVLPGELVVADEDSVRPERYWMPQFGAIREECEPNVSRLVERFREATSLHLRSDVPVGVLLSGGLDSGAIASQVAQAPGDHVALCAGYEAEGACDERADARRTAERLGMTVHEVVLDSRDFATCHAQLVKHVDEPVGDRAAMPQWALYAAARGAGFKVLLSGVGGDELFFGYPEWNSRAAALEAHYFGPPNASREWADWGPTQTNVRRSLKYLVNEHYRDLLKTIDDPLVAAGARVGPGPDRLASMVWDSYLVGNGLMLADKLGMGCSVEVRVPLLDHEFVEAILGIPARYRFGATETKPLLRRLTEGVLPEEVVRAPKRGFTPPASYIEKMVAEKAELILEGIVGSEFLSRKVLFDTLRRQTTMPWLRRERVRRAVGLDRSTELLYRVMAFEEWGRLCGAR